ncbi:hypothetical protein FRB90_008374 [Tulasnella sp. 427]|nr:hypothetical protein FRB90_008374 [Tulasnella sp. 427]
MILADLMAFAYDNSPPAAVILLSGDGDFSYAVSTLRNQRYSVILIHPSSSASHKLRVQSDLAVNAGRIFGPSWEDALALLPPLVYQDTSPDQLPVLGSAGDSSRQDDTSGIGQIEAQSTGLVVIEVTANGTEEEIADSPTPPNIAPTSKEGEGARSSGSKSPQGHQQSQAVLYVPNNDSTSSDAPSVVPSIVVSKGPSSSVSEYSGPPPIPPRPSTHPSAKVTLNRPLVALSEVRSQFAAVEDPSSHSETKTESVIDDLVEHTSQLHDAERLPSLASPSISTASSSSLKDIPDLFVDLVDVLDQAHSMGIEYLNPETVRQMVLHRSPDLLNEAHVRGFESFLKLAQEQGIVEYSRHRLGVRLNYFGRMDVSNNR